MLTTFSETLVSFAKHIWFGLGAFPFLLFVITVSFSVKGIVLFFLAKRGLQKSKSVLPWLLLLFVVVGSMLEDFSWIIKLVQILIIPAIDYKIVLFFIRIAFLYILILFSVFIIFISF